MTVGNSGFNSFNIRLLFAQQETLDMRRDFQFFVTTHEKKLREEVK